jgi:hypothetical protein
MSGSQGRLAVPDNMSNLITTAGSEAQLFMEPMNEGFGLCGDIPNPGPTVLRQDDGAMNMEKVTVIKQFSQGCSPGAGVELLTWLYVLLSHSNATLKLLRMYTCCVFQCLGGEEGNRFGRDGRSERAEGGRREGERGG